VSTRTSADRCLRRAGRVIVATISSSTGWPGWGGAGVVGTDRSSSNARGRSGAAIVGPWVLAIVVGCSASIR
jgi:hypothetical protein